MICEKCGKNNPDVAAFCRFCGNPLQNAAGAAAYGANLGEAHTDSSRNAPASNYYPAANSSRNAPVSEYDPAANSSRNAPVSEYDPAANYGERRVSAAHARLMNMENKRAAAGNPRGYAGGNPNGYNSYGGGPQAGNPNGYNSYGGGPQAGNPNGYSSYGGGPQAGNPNGYNTYGGGPQAGNPNGYNTYGGGQNAGNPNTRGPYRGSPNAMGPNGRNPYDGSAAGVRKSLAPSKWLFLLIGEAVAAFIIFVVVITLFSGNGTADATAERYFISLVNGNYKNAFSCMDLEEDDFINNKELEFAMSSYDFSRVDNYKLEKANVNYEYSNAYRNNDDELGKTCVILFRNKGDSYDSRFDINMVKSGKSGKWYVSSGDLITENFGIMIPVGASLKIDEINVPDKYAKVQKDEYSGAEYLVYTIPRIFRGQHYISVIRDGFQEYRNMYFVDGRDYHCDMTDQMLSRETMEKINALAVTNMQKIYQAALNKQGFETIADLFTSDPEKLGDIESEYNDLVARMNSEDDWVSSLDIQEITAESDAENPSSNLSFSCSGNCHKKNYSGEIEDQTGEADCNMSFNFKLENENWVQTNLGCRYIYF